MRTGAPRQRLAARTLVAYGIGQLGYSMMGLAVYVHLAKFYTDVALLSPTLVGLAVMLGRVGDAFLDPGMGFVSDSTHTRWGRRRPFLVISALPAALCFYLLWAPPATLTSGALFAYFTAVYLLLFVFWTVGTIPYHSLGAEISLDYHERTRLIAVRELFSVTGIVLGTLGPPVALLFAPQPRAAFAGMALVFAVVGAVTIVIPALTISEREEFQGRQPLPPWEGVQTSMRNRSFRTLLGTYFFTSVAGAVPAPLIPYMAEYVLKTPKLLPAYILVYLLVGILSLPFWVRWSHRLGKKDAWSISLVIAVLVSGATFFVGPGRSTLFFVLLACGGVSLGGGLALPASMQADVIDQDELETGTRREGAYFGLWAWVTKASAAITLFIALQIIGWAGYVPNVGQTPQVMLTMRLLYSVFPGVCYLAALIMFQSYPITHAVHQDIQARIAARSAAPPPSAIVA
jgi:GPH family glycoside/pentoside/hexuronide:cation symporter